jgi:arylsulfatase A-like enzyme
MPFCDARPGQAVLYREGTHIAFILRGPGVPAGIRRDDLIEHIDLAALTLAAAGIPVPDTMQARNIMAPGYARRDAIFAARDRCDETMDRIRAVRTDRWLYIRNFHPRRPHLQPNAYKDAKPILIRLRELRAAGELEPLSERILFAPTRPEEELYEWIEGRWEVNNLASLPSHRLTLEIFLVSQCPVRSGLVSCRRRPDCSTRVRRCSVGAIYGRRTAVRLY